MNTKNEIEVIKYNMRTLALYFFIQLLSIASVAIYSATKSAVALFCTSALLGMSLLVVSWFIYVTFKHVGLKPDE